MKGDFVFTLRDFFNIVNDVVIFYEFIKLIIHFVKTIHYVMQNKNNPNGDQPMVIFIKFLKKFFE